MRHVIDSLYSRILRFCTDVRNGAREITADDYPSFLFDLTEVRDGDDMAGFLQGQFLEKVRPPIMRVTVSNTNTLVGCKDSLHWPRLCR